MAGALHTYGATCRLGERANSFMRRASVVSDTPPKLRAQFFYSSLLPIDDPLSPVPTAGAYNKQPPRPFSSFDNEQLEKEWLGIQGEATGASLAVGLNRLHTVEMPELEMRPIYWSPVHDVSSVVRATWFYKDMMSPVPPDIANHLEAGYQQMKPWTETYNDEVNSCLSVGPEAELRLVHRLFPSRGDTSRPSTSATMTSKLPDAPVEVSDIPYSDRAAGKFESTAWEPQVKYAQSDCVMYASAREAQILRANQAPVPRGKRKPLADIRKGKEVGIVVVRGFDARAWLAKQPLNKVQQMATREFQRQRARAASNAMRNRTPTMPKAPPAADLAFRQPGLVRSTNTRADESIGFNDTCEACIAEERKPEVSDLVLVIHGIGQKLSEKVETFHFTHSINAVRRQFAIELEESQVRNIVRKELSSVMVLPVNWRSRLQIGDDKSEDSGVAALKDITPDTIPSVRSLVSDVLLDIPYYLSHHKPKMIEAVVSEANRIYRLWCRNNPGFQGNGRVHIIAHSLGSVMATDILSVQPTRIPKEIDFDTVPSSKEHFDFDTTNLFFAGSPAGLFMLLNHARLRPRRGRNKPGADATEYDDDELVSEQGTYGCLAIDNIYNIVHYNDPVAYKLNATVDTGYAASIQEAVVPTSAATWAQAFNNLLFRTATRSHTSLAKARTIEQLSAAAVADLRSRGKGIPNMPVRNVEMETHDFDAEQIAEKKMYMLNDNGQIDWFISSGGTIEFQYLDMLGAHSSYWTLQDFVRFVLVEVGRTPGRDEVIASIKASKKKPKWEKR